MSEFRSVLATQESVYRVRNWREFMAPVGRGRASGPFTKFARMGLEPGMGVRDLIRKRLLGLPNGPAAYGVWILLTHVAAETSVPGCFVDGEVPLSLEDLALVTDVRLDAMREALESLTRPDIRLIEVVSLEEALTPEVVDLHEDKAVEHVSNVLGTSLKAGSVPLAPTVQDSHSVSRDSVGSTLVHESVKMGLEPDSDAFGRIEAYSTTGAAGTMEACPSSAMADIEQTEQQISRLMGMFNQVEQMKRDAEAFSERGPLTHLMNPSRSKKVRSRRR